MNCPYCEAPTERRYCAGYPNQDASAPKWRYAPYCCAVCRLADQAEAAHFRRPYLSELRSDEPYPNFMRELRSILLAARAMTHRVKAEATYG